ncbi:uncharacterized protein LOC126743779 [Anthonomus grandis grandis]|uniref:uncharacterized protein LOC126743779 n=1 Tax=Anthonomus grandis grandis TaxID=2921223 RepID=UPI0021653B82|nr:uncharacterized protein LOC126743779 [Anthonomus grandis grandis]
MKSFGIFVVLFAFIALSLAGGHDHDDYYKSSHDDSNKVVYVEKESRYNRPSYKVEEGDSEYKNVVYKYEEPDEKKVRVDVKVVKQQGKDENVLYKYLEDYHH